jgi:hypothetical protein
VKISDTFYRCAKEQREKDREKKSKIGGLSSSTVSLSLCFHLFSPIKWERTTSLQRELRHVNKRWGEERGGGERRKNDQKKTGKKGVGNLSLYGSITNHSRPLPYFSSSSVLSKGFRLSKANCCNAFNVSSYGSDILPVLQLARCR